MIALCPKCKIGKLYIISRSERGDILKVKCIICGKVFYYKKLKRKGK